MKESKKNFNVLLFFKGFLMGIAEIIPGVSGSTLALIVGIYEDFISLLYGISNSVKEVFKFLIFQTTFEKVVEVFKKIDFKFAVILFLGMFSAILLLSNVVSTLLDSSGEYVMAFFFGLVLASVVIPWGRIKKKSFREVAIVLLVAVAFFLILRPQDFSEMSNSDAPSLLYFFFGGALGVCAMVLPGVSGSFVFLMIGIYRYIVDYISNLTRLEFDSFEIFALVAVALGIFFGFTFFVRLLKYGLKNHSSIIFAFLTGLMLASLRVIWPYYDVVSFDGIALLSLTALVGFVMVSFLKKLG